MFIKQKYRIYPNKEQQSIINQWIGSTRFIWNYMLALNIEHYKETNKFIFGYDMNNMLPKMKKQEEYRWLKKTPSQGLQQKCQDLDTALKSSFRKENKFGFPKFKSKKTDESGIRFNDFKIIDNKLYLPKIKKGIKIIIDRDLLGKSGLITIIKDTCNCYYVSISVNVGDLYNKVIDKKEIKSAIGIDVGIKNFLITSNGEYVDNPHFLKKQNKKLKKKQRQLSKKQNKSKNRDKARLKLAKLHKKISNQRFDFIKQNASMITKLYDFVSVENLNVKGMIKNHNLAQSIIDVSFSSFLNELEWQCKKRGKIFYKIDRFFPSSKTCHSCGYITEMLRLSDRTYKCPKCGMFIDRDLNAAINILRKGLKDNNIPLERGKLTPIRYENTLVFSE